MLRFWKMSMIWMFVQEPLLFHKEARKHDIPPEIVECLWWFVERLTNLRKWSGLGSYFSHRKKRKSKNRNSPGSDIRLIQIRCIPNLQLNCHVYDNFHTCNFLAKLTQHYVRLTTHFPMTPDYVFLSFPDPRLHFLSFPNPRLCYSFFPRPHTAVFFLAFLFFVFFAVSVQRHCSELWHRWPGLTTILRA